MLSYSRISKLLSPLALGAALTALPLFAPAALAQDKKPNILMPMTDDTGLSSEVANASHQ